MTDPPDLQAVTLPVSVENVTLRKDKCLSVRVASTREYSFDETIPLHRLQGSLCTVLLQPEGLGGAVAEPEPAEPKAQTPSQKLRFALEREARLLGREERRDIELHYTTQINNLTADVGIRIARLTQEQEK